MSVLLFVYGTLKCGFSRNYALNGQLYLGTARTTPEYGMYTTGGYPALLNQKLAETNQVKAEDSIYGELWEVDDECIMKIDKIEGTDVNLFERLPIDITEINLTRLPLSKSAWNLVQNKKAHAYLFKQPVHGASCCGEYWSRK